MKKVIHVDMDAFYASVEQRDRPELRGLPVLVGGNPEGRGVVASASYEARRFGVRSAMSARLALRICPRAVFVRPDFSKYKEVSRRIRAIFFDYTDLVEPLSLDEAYLDVTQNKVGEVSATKIAQTIRARIRSELNLTASAGVAPNKFLAKLASDIKKPDGLFVIPPDRVHQFLLELPVERLWGVGPATTKRLKEFGISTTADIRRHKREDMLRLMGSFGAFLHGLAFGEDNREVRSYREPKSRGAETTFETDILAIGELEQTIDELSDDVSKSLIRLQRKAMTVTLKLRYSDFTTITRSRTLRTGFDERETIQRVARELLGSSTEAGKRPVRLVGVSTSHFVEPEGPEQLMLGIE
jgi:DNA polymerase IV